MLQLFCWSCGVVWNGGSEKKRAEPLNVEGLGADGGKCGTKLTKTEIEVSLNLDCGGSCVNDYYKLQMLMGPENKRTSPINRTHNLEVPKHSS